MSWHSEPGWWEVIAAILGLGFAYWLGRHQQHRADEAERQRIQEREHRRQQEAHERYRNLLIHLGVLARRVGTELERILKRWEDEDRRMNEGSKPPPPVLEEAPFLLAATGWNALSPRLAAQERGIELHAALAYFFADVAAAHAEFQRLRDLQQNNDLDTEVNPDYSEQHIERQHELLQHELHRLSSQANKWADDLHEQWKAEGPLA